MTDTLATAEIISLPQLVHSDSDRWKQDYLQWLDDVGHTLSGDQTLEEQLLIRDDLSYWWMTLPTEPCFQEDAVAYKIIRIWAFVELADRLGLSSIDLVDPPADIRDVLKSWALKTGRQVTESSQSNRKHSRAHWRKRLRNSGNLFIQIPLAIGTIARDFVRYGFSSGSHCRDIYPLENALTIVDYFANFKTDQSSTTKYASNYWGRLPLELASMGIPVNWIHIDYRSSATPTTAKARQTIKRLNQNSCAQHHSLLQDAMCPSVLISAVRQYFAIMRLGTAVIRNKKIWGHSPSQIDMWPLVEASWRRDFFGIEAAQNALSLKYFEASVKRQKIGSCMYLMENQPWELALISHWKSLNSGTIYGVPHSTVRKWDLRYAIGFNPEGKISSDGLPSADVILVNGTNAFEQLIKNGYQPERLQIVEALRYVQVAPCAANDVLKCRESTNPLKIVAFGEFDSVLVEKQIDILNKLIKDRSPRVQIVFRPHPASSHSLLDLDMRVQVSYSPNISTDLAGMDVAFCTNVSSAVMDAFLAGVPTVVFLDGRVLDGRIESLSGSFTISSAQELVATIDKFMELVEYDRGNLKTGFCLDPELPQWKWILKTSHLFPNECSQL